MKTVAVIPARFASTRFPGKPLARDTGKTLIQHVYEAVRRCSKIERVIVATDDHRIADAVKSFGGEAMMTRPDHPTGTDRVAEAAAAMRLDGDDLVLNVQGDEPEIDAASLDRLIERMDEVRADCGIGTLAATFPDDAPREGPGSPLDPNCVKVVMDGSGLALYFSRSLIPYPRDTGGVADRPSRWLLHLGVYAFRADVLGRIAGASGEHRGSKVAGARILSRTSLAEVESPAGAIPARRDSRTSPASAESLEQLRWLEQGHPIAVVLIDHAFVGIDTPEDYAALVRRYTRRAADF